MKFILFALFFYSLSYAEENGLKSGPMLGYVDYREALIWLQTENSAEVSVNYWEKGSGKIFYLSSVTTEKSNAFTAKFICDSVLPGKTYSYSVQINGREQKFDYPLEFKTQSLWKHRTNPPDFKFGAGSCAYVNEEFWDRPGKPYGGDYKIFNSIVQKEPEFFIWLGDNTYYREGDWNSFTGMAHRYTHTRSLKELSPLLAFCPNYAIWDDHDYGPNDSDRGFWNKKTSLDIFKLFWGNPSFGFDEEGCAVTFFSFYDVDFFLLDNRYFRSPNDRKETGKATILGEKQIDWLIDNLTSSKANFKIVAMGGQFLNTYKKYENYSNYEKEREKIIEMIKREKIKGVIFLTGDRHFSELSILSENNQPSIVDFTVSTLTAGPNAEGCSEENELRVENCCFTNRNFGMIEINGKEDERKIKFTIYNSDGMQAFSKEYTLKELNNK